MSKPVETWRRVMERDGAKQAREDRAAGQMCALAPCDMPKRHALAWVAGHQHELATPGWEPAPPAPRKRASRTKKRAAPEAVARVAALVGA